jgi:formylglycine-generating enzyme
MNFTKMQSGFILMILLLYIVPAGTSCRSERKQEDQQDNTSLPVAKQSKAPSTADTVRKESPKPGTGMESELGEMVLFEEGTCVMGNDEGPPAQQPAHEVQVNPFYLDKHPVTANEFRPFIEETGYKTDAEVFGDAGVFLFSQGRWTLLKGATWEHPQGPD